MTNPPPEAPKQPVFHPDAAHQAKPKVRPLRGFPVEATSPQGQKVQMLGLADARQIAERIVVTAPGAHMLIPLMDGSRTLPDLVSQVGKGLTMEFLQQFVAQLDDACLLEGPNFAALLAKSRAEFDSLPNLPPAGSAQFADALVDQHAGGPGKASEAQKTEQGPQRLRELFDQWIAKVLEKAEKPSFDQLPKAIMAPHLDYPRGWMNYAAVYGRLRVCDRPDRVIILGTNHFGMGTGVVGCDKGYETPLGTCQVDRAVVDGLRKSLGDKLFENRFDHEREHSIELQVPWIQHAFGKNDRGEFPTVFGALIHDPSVNGGESYDGKGISLDSFVSALKTVLAGLPGRTLIISSADLSHVGPAFGDAGPMVGDKPETEAARNKVVQHDLQMLEMVRNRQPRELITSLAWQQNPTRWCSIGNIAATLLLTEPTEVEMVNYGAAIDPQGHAMVSSAAMALR